jgi:hypothetical protein
MNKKELPIRSVLGSKNKNLLNFIGPELFYGPFCFRKSVKIGAQFSSQVP